MIIISEWRTSEEEYNKKGNLQLSKEEIKKALVELDSEELHRYFKQHIKTGQHSVWWLTLSRQIYGPVFDSISGFLLRLS
jgi:hypothetical protein